ncbi:MAG: alpha/beta fold hydrolase [Rhodospirillales bacterium]|nr:alpha/beta fold hydrolase [Rhodospirillales bacterium]
MDFLFDGPDDAPATLALAHGAGAPMDSPFMVFFAEGLAARGLRVVRFEFPYMAGRRTDDRKRGPDRPDVLLAAWREAIGKLGDPGRLIIGGKSMGGRIASLIADEAGVAGLVCLGYPFHPPRRPATLRTAHLAGLATPTLIVQGTRDPLGRPEEVAGYALSAAIRLCWVEDGDHDLVPRKRSGRTRAENWQKGVEAAAQFASACIIG